MIPSYFNYRESVNDFVDNYEIKKTLIELSCECNGMIERYFKEHTFEENIFELSTIHFQERFREDILYWSTFYQKAQLPFPIIITDTKTFKTESFIQHFNRAEYFNKILSEKNNIYISSYASPFIVVLNKVLLKMFLNLPLVVIPEKIYNRVNKQFNCLFHRIFENTINTIFKLNKTKYNYLYYLFDHVLQDKQTFFKNLLPRYEFKGVPCFKLNSDHSEKIVLYNLNKNYKEFLSSIENRLIFRNYLNIHKSLFRSDDDIPVYFLKYKEKFLDILLLSKILHGCYLKSLRDFKTSGFELYISTILDYMCEFEKDKQRFFNLTLLVNVLDSGIEI